MITNPTPLETPAVEAKVYTKLHVAELHAISPTTTSGVLAVRLRPATDSGELAPKELEQFHRIALFPTMNEVPELAAAFQAVLAAIPAVIAWKQAPVQE